MKFLTKYNLPSCDSQFNECDVLYVFIIWCFKHLYANVLIIMACQICRLCLKVINGNNFEIIEQVTKEILQKLLLNLNLDISKEPIICDECADKLQKSIDFKSICYYTEEETLLFMNPDKDATMNTNEICLTNNKSVGTADISKKQAVCRFCRKCIGQEYSGFLKDSKENLFIANVLERHIPELSFTVGEDTITCSLCFESIKNLYTFILHCLSVEEKIEKYVEVEGRDNKGQIDLNNVLKFTFTSTINHEVNFNHCIVPKTEELNYELIKNKYLKCTTMEGNEDGHQVESNYIQDVSRTNGSYPGIMESATVKIEIADEHLNEDENMIFNSPFNVKCENIGIKSEDFESFQDVTLVPNNMEIGDISADIYSRGSPLMVFTTQTDNISVNADAPHGCNLCLFATKYKKSLTRHMLTHKNPLDIKIYTCDMCPYKSKHKHNLNEHMLVHKNPSEIIMFKCELCSYEAKRKNNLTKHMVMHKSPSEISMFKCSLCTYEAKFNSDLKNHMICHKDISEVEMYKCQTCTFETKHKGYLKKHMRIHQLETEFRMYMCDECSFKTRHRDSLNQHKLSHKDLSEVTMFTCQVCSFQTRYKKVLTGHMIIHKDPSEIPMYKCELCPYETKRRNYLKMHALIHKNPSHITMYQCDMCAYQTKRKIYLKQHMVTHKKSMQHT